MEKTFNHELHEADIYSMWEASGAFTPQVKGGKKPFTIIMPPPNANDPLHIGHAREIATQDILIRFNRMKGVPTLWLPGADHAGIETQYVFEKRLREKGKSRFDYPRDELYGMIWDYVMQQKGTMEKQLRQLGASCDWTRFKFTLDPEIVKIVYGTFKKLYDDGLVYRDERIVNYCPRCGTNFSELEVQYKEVQDEIFHIDYGEITIATTRPETIFADVAVAVNPKDRKLKGLVGKTAVIPIINREIPIIGDSLVDMQFGTGALKVTPAHDHTDFEIGEKHDLPKITVIDEDGKMINTPARYVGLNTKEARKAVVEDLEKAGKLISRKHITHNVGHCYRCKGKIEPMPSSQWFVKVKPLTKLALEAIKEKKVVFTAKKYEKIAKHWLKILKDWNISRQIVWGIQIPAWRCDKCLEWVITDGKEPDKCPKCQNSSLTRDKDTFDTWFSSGQWPYATLMSTQKGDFEYFYPTSVMDPSYDILPFWVIRMIMLGLYKTKKVPFETVLLHGLVRDKNGIKISKSKGNVVDPIEMVHKYGTDALRIALIWGANIENDNSLSEDNIRGQRNFANKIWNVARYVYLEDPGKRGKKNQDDEAILKDLKNVSKRVTTKLDRYRINEAAEEVYDFIWNRFANDYLEKTKSRRTDAQKTLEKVLQDSLKLLHPFMPYVTEAIWQEGKNRFDSPLLISAKWPK